MLRPGSPLVASDSVHSADLEAFHEGDTYLPIDPTTLTDRLTAQGFVDVTIERHELGWAARAWTPA